MIPGAATETRIGTGAGDKRTGGWDICGINDDRGVDDNGDTNAMARH